MLEYPKPVYCWKPKSPSTDLPPKPTFCPLFYILLNGTIQVHPNLKPNMADTNDPSLPFTVPCTNSYQVPNLAWSKMSLHFIFLIGMAPSSIILIIKRQVKKINETKLKPKSRIPAKRWCFMWRKLRTQGSGRRTEFHTDPKRTRTLASEP